MTTTLDLHRLRRAAALALPADHCLHGAIRMAANDTAAQRYAFQLVAAMAVNRPQEFGRLAAAYAALAVADATATLIETAGTT